VLGEEAVPDIDFVEFVEEFEAAEPDHVARLRARVGVVVAEEAAPAPVAMGVEVGVVRERIAGLLDGRERGLAGVAHDLGVAVEGEEGVRVAGRDRAVREAGGGGAGAVSLHHFSVSERTADTLTASRKGLLRTRRRRPDSRESIRIDAEFDPGAALQPELGPDRHRRPEYQAVGLLGDPAPARGGARGVLTDDLVTHRSVEPDAVVVGPSTGRINEYHRVVNVLAQSAS
jgi:hypothetical protein